MREAIRQLIETHHAAFAVELLGASASGVSADQIESMLAAGLVDPAKLGGFVIPGMANACDPFLFARMVARLMADAAPDLRDSMRWWTLEQWLRDQRGPRPRRAAAGREPNHPRPGADHGPKRR